MHRMRILMTALTVNDNAVERWCSALNAPEEVPRRGLTAAAPPEGQEAHIRIGWGFLERRSQEWRGPTLEQTSLSDEPSPFS
jgi:hypothetical protein